MQLTLIREVFELFDTDGEQQLDEAELASAIFAMGFCQHGHAEVLCALFLSLIPPREQECKAHLPFIYPHPMGIIAQAEVCLALFQSLPRFHKVPFLLLWVNSISVSVHWRTGGLSSRLSTFLCHKWLFVLTNEELRH